MESLLSIQVFSRVAETGSFSKAAILLGIGQPAVTKHVAKVEKRFGLHLLNRNTRGVALTESGERFYERCKRIVAELEEIEAFAAEERQRTQGLLKLRAPLWFGHQVISPMVIDFMGSHPEMQVDLACINSLSGANMRGLDILIKIGPLADSSLTRRVIGTYPWVMIASPDYVKRCGEPVAVEEIADHDGLIYLSTTTDSCWRYEVDGVSHPIDVRTRIRTNNLTTIMDATIAGLGVSIVPLYLAMPALRQGSVQKLLGGEFLHQQDINAIFHSQKHMSPKIREFLSFAYERFRGKWWETTLTRI
jgi:DNA-binding transcriptional LysR family regulator